MLSGRSEYFGIRFHGSDDAQRASVSAVGQRKRKGDVRCSIVPSCRGRVRWVDRYLHVHALRTSKRISICLQRKQDPHRVALGEGTTYGFLANDRPVLDGILDVPRRLALIHKALSHRFSILLSRKPNHQRLPRVRAVCKGLTSYSQFRFRLNGLLCWSLIHGAGIKSVVNM